MERKKKCSLLKTFRGKYFKVPGTVNTLALAQLQFIRHRDLRSVFRLTIYRSVHWKQAWGLFMQCSQPPAHRLLPHESDALPRKKKQHSGWNQQLVSQIAPITERREIRLKKMQLPRSKGCVQPPESNRPIWKGHHLLSWNAQIVRSKSRSATRA